MEAAAGFVRHQLCHGNYAYTKAGGGTMFVECSECEHRWIIDHDRGPRDCGTSWPSSLFY